MEAIIAAAAVTFRDLGYEAATLEGLADQLGITRSAILHHFGSKNALLDAVVTPLTVAFDELLQRTEALAPLSDSQLAQFVTEFVDMMCEHRAVASLLARNMSVQAQLPPSRIVANRLGRFANVVSGPDPTPEMLIRALSGLGAVLRPVAGAEDIIDLSQPEARAVVVRASLAAFHS